MQFSVPQAKADPIKAVCAVTLVAFLAALSVIDPVLAIASVALSAGLLAWPQRRQPRQNVFVGRERAVR